MKTMKILVFALAAVMSFSIVDAQKKPKADPTVRSVQGSVMDSGENLINGAVVQLKDPKTLQIRSFITKEDGTYHFYGLNRNADYELKADYQGASSPWKPLSSFDSRDPSIINLQLETKK